jgi:G3E family GTPase
MGFRAHCLVAKILSGYLCRVGAGKTTLMKGYVLSMVDRLSFNLANYVGEGGKLKG